jgi:hypothetical protein
MGKTNELEGGLAQSYSIHFSHLGGMLGVLLSGEKQTRKIEVFGRDSSWMLLLTSSITLQQASPSPTKLTFSFIS